MTLQLSWSEATLAAQAGVMRRMLHLKNATHETYGSPGEPWDVDIEAAAAELVVCKALGCHWTGMEASGSDRRLGIPDAGGVQVRSTRREAGCLILHEEDRNDDLFVLVVGRIPRFEIKGWVYGSDGKRRAYWRSDTRTPAYFVPQVALGPAYALAAEVADSATAAAMGKAA